MVGPACCSQDTVTNLQGHSLYLSRALRDLIFLTHSLFGSILLAKTSVIAVNTPHDDDRVNLLYINYFIDSLGRVNFKPVFQTNAEFSSPYSSF